MSSESEKRLSNEELKKRNQPQEITTPPPSCPTEEQWRYLMRLLNAQHRLLETQNNTMEAMWSTMQAMSSQAEAQTKELLTIHQQMEQAGRKKERRLSLPKIHLPHPSWAWLWAIPITVGLLTIWYTSGALWNNLVIPFLQLLQ